MRIKFKALVPENEIHYLYNTKDHYEQIGENTE
jgi:hypothetical protein